MKTIDDAGLEALQAKHGRVARVQTEIGDIVLRKPSKPEFKASFHRGFFDLKMAVNYDALDRMARDLLVFPSLEEFDAMLEDAPGMLLLLLDPIVQLSGLVAQERVKK